MHWHLANPTVNLAGTRFGRISEKCPDSRFVGVEIGYNQWRRSKFILRGRNFFPSKGGGRSQRPKSRGGVLGERQRASCPPARGCGEHCKLPQQGPGLSPGKFEICCNLRPQNSLQKCLTTCRLLQKG